MNIKEQARELFKDLKPSSRWTHLDAGRSGLLSRCEDYAALTIPSAFLRQGTSDNMELRHAPNSVGPESVNGIVAKLMLGQFAPSRVFFRIDASEEIIAQFSQVEVTAGNLAEVLSIAEQKAIKYLDKANLRPKLTELFIQLVITGNVLFYLGDDGDDDVRVIGLRDYVVQRDIYGNVSEVITKDKIPFGRLDKEIRDSVAKKDPDESVCLYKWVKFHDGKAYMCQYIDDNPLAEKFSGSWPAIDCPFRPIAWRLADKCHYGTGLVEDYSGELNKIYIVSNALREAAVLSSRVIYGVDPAGMMDVDDFNGARNGDAIPATKDGIFTVTPPSVDMSVLFQIVTESEARVRRGFLVTNFRNGERVTAEEIRLQVSELEQGLGSVYARLAKEVQGPLARWLLKKIDFKIKEKDLEPIIITGMEALSRTGDIANMSQFLQSVALMKQMDPSQLSYLKQDEITAFFASAYGISSSKFVKTQAELNEELQAQAQAQSQQALQSQAAANVVDQQTAPENQTPQGGI